MKNCKSIEKKLTAFLHGELTENNHQVVEAHLEGCDACVAALEAQRAALNLLGAALETAPAPEKLNPWWTLQHRGLRRRATFADVWFSPQFKAVCLASVFATAFLMLSGILVVFKVMPKKDAEIAFAPPPAVQVPKMPLRKLSPGSSTPAKPKSTAKIVTSVEQVEPQRVVFPDLASSGIGSGSADSSGSVAMYSTEYVTFSEVAAPPVKEFNREQYDQIVDNAYKMVMENPLSTFSIDVDRASYANMRRFLNSDQLPPPDAVRVEEMINYFDYDYPQPRGEDPFAVNMELASCPWNTDHQLALIGLQGLEIDTENLPPNNLVFLLDVSGSMSSPDKLPLLQSAMRLLVGQLRREDRVSIVVYAGAAGVVLEPTSNKNRILAAIDRLNADGSTAGGAGIELAYRIAQKSFIEQGNNRVILATDGDFNVGVSSDSALVRLIEEKRESGVFLSVLGFGTGNLQDSKMEKLADKGNGNYAYIDDILEAKKVLVTEMGGTLFTIAKDVKVQIEFNPAQVKAYRLIGYENRIMARADFADDSKDAGELGAGHAVTALYELIPSGSDEIVPSGGELKYQVTGLVESDELMTVKLRYKKPDGDISKLIVQSVAAADLETSEPSENIRFASAVAEFGMLLRDSEYKGTASYDRLLRRAKYAKGSDLEGYRSELIRLIEKAQLLDRE